MSFSFPGKTGFSICSWRQSLSTGQHYGFSFSEKFRVFFSPMDTMRYPRSRRIIVLYDGTPSTQHEAAANALFLWWHLLYAEHSDTRSRSCVNIPIDNSVSIVAAMSRKQSVVTKSSTQAELIALDTRSKIAERLQHWAILWVQDGLYGGNSTPRQQVCDVACWSRTTNIKSHLIYQGTILSMKEKIIFWQPMSSSRSSIVQRPNRMIPNLYFPVYIHFHGHVS